MTLKYIAVLSMLIDHFAASFFIIYTSYYDKCEDFRWADQIYLLLRGIGRSAFPIFCFVLVEGFLHTKSRIKYMLRLMLFAILSELPFDLALQDSYWEIGSQNVFWTLLIGFLVLWAIEKLRSMHQYDVVFRYSASFVVGMVAMLFAELLKTDYSAFGVLLIWVLYELRESRLSACVAGYLCLIWEAWCFPAFLFIYFYNGERGKGLKYFFYSFYPLHLLVLYGVRLFVLNGR